MSIAAVRVVSISDTHLEHRFKVPDGDLLIHAGDGTYGGSQKEVRDWLRWMSALPHPYKVFIAGNHDWLFQKSPMDAAQLVAEFPTLCYLQDSEITINGLRIYGSPWQPEFCHWAFNVPRGPKLKEKWDNIPYGLDILVTHGPPFGYGDQLERGNRVGDEALTQAVEATRPKVHVCGHIHCGYGVYQLGSTTVRNVAVCDEQYVPINAPHVFEL